MSPQGPQASQGRPCGDSLCPPLEGAFRFNKIRAGEDFAYRRNLLFLLLMVLFTANLFSQEFHGLVLKNDSLDTPILQASILVSFQGNQSTINLGSLPDGSYRFALKKSLKYSVKISYASGDYADTTFFFTTDKNDKPSAQNVIVRMKKNGIWLSEYGAFSVRNFFPHADATVIVKNVMTRQERRYTTMGTAFTGSGWIMI